MFRQRTHSEALEGDVERDREVDWGLRERRSERGSADPSAGHSDGLCGVEFGTLGCANPRVTHV